MAAHSGQSIALEVFGADVHVYAIGCRTVSRTLLPSLGYEGFLIGLKSNRAAQWHDLLLLCFLGS